MAPDIIIENESGLYEWHKSKMSGREVLSDSFSTSDGNDAFSFPWKNDKYETLLMAGSDGTTITYTFTIVQATSE